MSTMLRFPDQDFDPSIGFQIGVDVGAVNDFPAVCVVAPREHYLLDDDGQVKIRCDGNWHNDPLTGQHRPACERARCHEETEWRYPVSTLRRLPRGRTNRQLTGAVATICANLRDHYPEAPISVYADRRGIGLSVFQDLPDALKARGLADVHVAGVAVNAGEGEPTGFSQMSVGKVRLVQTLHRLVEHHLIELPSNLEQAGAVMHELLAFKPKQTATSGALSFEAERTGDHDDLVTALALAVLVAPGTHRAQPLRLPASWGIETGWE